MCYVNSIFSTRNMNKNKNNYNSKEDDHLGFLGVKWFCLLKGMAEQGSNELSN